jgi:hypothetical protein
LQRLVINRHIDGMAEVTRLENFLYLLTEMERALALGGIEWTAPSAARVRERLIAIATEVAVIAERSENAN